MRKYFLFALLFFAIQSAFSQEILSGTIRDSETGLPVDYVNIGLVAKAQGTVSDMDGSFELKLIQARATDTVRISRIGYEPLEFLVGDLESRLKESAVISMQEENTALDEVVITPKDAKKNRIGFNYITRDLVAYWNDIEALGGEHASKIMVRKGPVKLEDLSFQVVRNITDSLLVRVNVYEVDKGMPGRNISRENILYTVKEKYGWVIIDLSPYDIVVDDHFIVSLEMLKVYGDKAGMTIAAYHDGYRSYSRLISQDRWQRMRKGTTISFNLNTSEVERVNKKDRQPKKLPKPEVVSILWDNSLSMENKDLNKEIGYLDTFFKKLGNTTVHFQTFGYELGTQKVFDVKRGNWEGLKQHINQITYDGGTRQVVTEELSPKEFTLIFTDGMDFAEDVHRDWTGRVYTINSSSEANLELLADIAFETGADFINLTDRHDLDRAADYKRMQGNYASRSWEKNDTPNEYITVRGNVSDYEDSLEKVLVEVKNTDRKSRTDAEGNFEIQALPGELLKFSYPGRISIEALVNTGNNFLTIAMPVGVKVLDEVVVSKRSKEAPVSIGVYGEKEKITTNYGVLDPAKIGFKVRQIKGEDLFQGATNLADALRGKFSGVRVVNDYSSLVRFVGRGPKTFDDPQGTSRPRNMFGSYRPRVITRSGAAAWDIDGLFYAPDQFPDNIMVQNIKTITIMPGVWAASKYGKEANGGIVIVRTINNNFDDIEARKDPLEDQARLKDNYYKGDAIFQEVKPENQSAYLRNLSASSSVEEAYGKYLVQRSTWMTRPDYFADVHDFFNKDLNAVKRGQMIVSSISEVHDNNINALRLLAYKYDETGQFENSLEIYKKIFNLAPKQRQSVRDLAHAHVNTGEYKESWKLYNEYLDMAGDSLASEGLDQVVRQEMLELVEEHHEVIDLNKNKFILDEDKEDISIIVQWNNPNAEFELQFVGPNDQYYTWKHTEADNALLLGSERIDGTFSKNFGIQDIGEGPWKINTNYLGNKESTPTYLKFSIRNNLKTKETVRVLKLQKTNINFRSFDITEDKITTLLK